MAGNLRLIGGGDPTSGRAIPYRMGPVNGNHWPQLKNSPIGWWLAESGASMAISSATIPGMCAALRRRLGDDARSPMTVANLRAHAYRQCADAARRSRPRNW